jgi:hypothetical protein
MIPRSVAAAMSIACLLQFRRSHQQRRHFAGALNRKSQLLLCVHSASAKHFARMRSLAAAELLAIWKSDLPLELNQGPTLIDSGMKISVSAGEALGKTTNSRADRGSYRRCWPPGDGVRRDPAKPSLNHPNLTVFGGDVLYYSSVENTACNSI